MPQHFSQQPSENKDYDFNWTDWLQSGDTISSSVVTSDSGITLGTKTVTSAVVKQWISGGTNNHDYKITCKITTDQGRVDEREITIHIRES